MDSVLDEVRSVVGDVLDRGDGSWRALQDAGLLALAAPKEHGGESLGLAEVDAALANAVPLMILPLLSMLLTRKRTLAC